MKPRIISKIGTNITIKMPFPNSMARKMFSLKSWQQSYDFESISWQILVEAEKNNAHITDIKILWCKCDFYFELYFDNLEEFNQFTQSIENILN